MAEENNQGQQGAEAEQNAQPQFSLERIYLKDLSYETPMGVEAFKTQLNPHVNQELSTKTNKVEGDYYEVILTLTITVKNKGTDDVVYLTEVQQAGLFLVSGIEGKQLAQVLNTHCLNILFPYAREVVDSVVTKGSFPALMLPPINFDALFQQALAQAKEQGESDDKAETTH